MQYIVKQFVGEETHKVTGVPAVVGEYETERYGTLQTFTVSTVNVGETVEYTDVRGITAPYVVMVNEFRAGSAEVPSEHVFVACKL